MLRNLKILDFSGLLPGPFGTMTLADLGAKVISIQRHNETPLFEGFSNFASMLNRNKTILPLNLKDEKAIDLIHDIIKEYDIVVEGFRPGVMKRLGLDFESLKQINPKIIYCSITGYGQTGPYNDRAGHDINYLALSGIASYSGKIGEGPHLSGVQIADLSGSLYLAISLLAAYIHRQSTGEGQYIDLSMTDCVFSLGILQNLRYLATGKVPKYEDTALTGSAHYGFYETRDKKYLSVGSLEPKFYIGLCQAFGIDPLSNEENVKIELKKLIQTMTLDKLLDRLNPFDICIEPVLNLEETINQQFFALRDNIIKVRSEGKMLKQQAHPIKYSKYKPGYMESKLWESNNK